MGHKKPPFLLMKSEFGDRDTVGTTYLKAQKNSTKGLNVADIGGEMVGGFVYDVNEAFQSNPFEGQTFYVNVVEERDLQMKKALKRRIFSTKYIPYPEDNTTVFRVIPKEERVEFCWDLPHHSEFLNILSNRWQYDTDYIENIRDWVNGDLINFGFVKVSMDSSQTMGYDDKTIKVWKESYHNYCETLQMDEKSIEAEKKLGFFWLPNKYFKYSDVTDTGQKILLTTG